MPNFEDKGATAPGGTSSDHPEPPTQPRNEVQVDRDAADLLEPSIDTEPKQVEQTYVIFVPNKDFEARVNQTVHPFRAGIPTRVTHDVAAMLMEDKNRGYIKE